MAAAIHHRRTDRRSFGDRPVTEAELTRLRRCVEAEGVYLRLLPPDQIPVLAVSTELAAVAELDDPAYRADLHHWTTRPTCCGPARPRRLLRGLLAGIGEPYLVVRLGYLPVPESLPPVPAATPATSSPSSSRCVMHDPPPAYDEADLRRAAEAGIRAPSLHNSQPWLFRLCGGGIEIRIDPDPAEGPAHRDRRRPRHRHDQPEAPLAHLTAGDRPEFTSGA